MLGAFHSNFDVLTLDEHKQPQKTRARSSLRLSPSSFGMVVSLLGGTSWPVPSVGGAAFPPWMVLAFSFRFRVVPLSPLSPIGWRILPQEWSTETIHKGRRRRRKAALKEGRAKQHHPK